MKVSKTFVAITAAFALTGSALACGGSHGAAHTQGSLQSANQHAHQASSDKKSTSGQHDHGTQTTSQAKDSGNVNTQR
ncbi:hypothetical protein [Pandoraea sputorum]|uniref:hypothetical protein n=1 Tax=Pandoraea sputorum TaxID=93222 RepID=UPI002AF6B5BE|nr:hypothetical protein [Pandoraea sputorum]